jgi:release factor glutamine methyltransferase
MAVGLADTARARLDAARQRLAAAGIDTARNDAEWLLAGLLGVGRAHLLARLDAPLDDDVAARFEAVVSRRAAREPLQRILGWEGFRGLRIDLTPDVLVPRPETEVLAGWALDLLPPQGVPHVTVLDVGTGSGCVACALAHERPDLRVIATDVSLPALLAARRNIASLGLDGRVRVVAGDLVGVMAPSSVDLVIANLPYLPTDVLPTLAPEVTGHEPIGALDGGCDGLRLVCRLIADAPRVLKRGGAIVLETAGAGQASDVAAWLRASGWGEVQRRADLAGIERFVAARIRDTMEVA